MERIRLLRPSAALKTAGRAWNRFWFQPQAPSTVALLRVGVGLVTVAWTLMLASDFDNFLGPAGLASGPRFAPLLAGALLVAAVCLTIGLQPRLAAAAVFCCLVELYRIDPLVWNTGDVLLRHLAFFLVLMPSGDAFSVDAERRSRRHGGDVPARAPWGLRLVQLQVALMYAVSFTYKVRGSTWRNGTAVSFVLRVIPDQRLVLPGAISTSTALAHLLTWGTLAVEGAIPLLVWNRRTRPFVLACGVALHLVIDLTLRTGLFSWVVLASYLAFVPPERATSIIRRFGPMEVAET